jgi:hypothetical protein
MDILRKEKLYLSMPDKLQFFAKELCILGHVINKKGIVMDPHKVDQITNWKAPQIRPSCYNSWVPQATWLTTA